MLFRLENLGKEFGGNWLFEGLSAQCNAEDRIGLIGRNGVGKTTLFNLIDGTLGADSGQVYRASRLEIARIEQIPRLNSERTVLQETMRVFEGLKSIEGELRQLEHEMADHELSEEVADRYAELKHLFELGGGYDFESRCQKVLQGLGFSREDLDLQCSRLSGGQRSRVMLAQLLLKPADMLLLDEPTNHLDLTGIFWLSEYLSAMKKPFVLVSHDRHFLDGSTNRTWELEEGTLFDYPSAFTLSRLKREERRRLQFKEFERQQEWRRQTEDFIRKNIVGQKTKQAQSRRKQLEKAEWMLRPEEERLGPIFKIPEAPRGGAIVTEISNGCIGFPGKELISSVNLTVYRGDRVGILGGNGSGKSTLLRTILGELPLLAGHCEWGHNNIPSYFAQEAAFASPDQTVLDVLAELRPSLSDEELRGFAALFLFRQDDTFKKVEHLSGGERSRLSLARLFSKTANALFLDEPTNHLDIQSRESLEGALANFGGSLVVVSHDIYFLRQVVSRFILIRDGQLVELPNLDNLAEALQGKKPSSVVTKETAEEKRLRVPMREGLSKNEKMRLQQKIDAVELEIAELEERRTAVDQELHTGVADHVHLLNLSQEYENLNRRLAELYGLWEEFSHTLEQG